MTNSGMFLEGLVVNDCKGCLAAVIASCTHTVEPINMYLCGAHKDCCKEF